MRPNLLLSVLAVAAVASRPALAQIRVNPTGVNVNAQGATTVFLTFGGLAGYEAAEAFWCGQLIPASPAIGLRCDPGTIYGSLPLRFDRSGLSGASGLTDIMTIPPSVSRRAYQAAEAGTGASFFYVRRFRRPAGGPDQYVAVTCRLTGGGARSPLSLTNVKVAFQPEASVLQVTQGDRVRINFRNGLPETTTVHWHGLILPNEMDGPAEMTQEPIPPGGSYVYEFTVGQAGTFFYHSHNEPDRQQALGLYGALIIAPRDSAATALPAAEYDTVIQLQEWLKRELADLSGHAHGRRPAELLHN